MGAAFTEEEQVLIKKELIKTARLFLSKYGMKKTSVDQIVAEVNISKGAFYKFYETKELLFFDVMEDIHDDIYIGIDQILEETKDLPTEVRLEKAIFYTLNIFNETSILNFITNELPLVLRKIPPEKLHLHAIDDSVNIERILKKHNITLSYPDTFIASLVRAIVSLSRQKELIGEEHYIEVLQFIIHNACLGVKNHTPF